jgi:spore coat protein CotH
LPLSKRLRQLAWTAIVSTTLALLALVSKQNPTAADTPPRAPRLPQTWHTVYIPLVTRQESPTPPLYRLSVAPQDLDSLYANPHSDDTVPGVLTYLDTDYDVEVRFRGGTARDLPKKSWKIKFPASTLFQGQRELNLNAEYTDKSLLREALAYDLFERAGLPASRTHFARLEINGRYMGLFLQVEQVDQRFLERIGWDPNGNLYKGNYGNFERSNDYLAYQESYDKKTNTQDSHDDIIAFVEMINATPEADFPAALAAVMDVGYYLDWLAVQIALGNFEWLEKNYYIHHQLDQDYWAILPWDLDLLLGHNWSWQHGILNPGITWQNPIDSGTWWSVKADGKWNKLVTKVLRDDDFKFAYCRRLRELLNDEFAAGIMFQRIDAFYQLIIPYAVADPYKWGSNSDFHAGPNELKTYVTNRIAWLNTQIPGYCPQNGPLPFINELMSNNATTKTDEAGEHEPWIELYNPGLVSFDAGGMRLALTATGTLTRQWTIPDGTIIPPGDFILLWADGEPEEGPLHTSFRLDAGGGTLTLLDKTVHGGQGVDQRTFGPLGPDISFGRAHDGGETWLTFNPSTPGWSNRGRPPLITATAHLPAEPGAGQPVTVSATVGDEAPGLLVSLYWSADGAAQVSPMYDGDHGRYSAVIPPLGNGTVVTYYVQAGDAAGMVSADPPRPWVAQHGYVVGFQRPSLYLNELVAINQDTLEDEAGESDDWFEIHNSGPTSVDLGGMYLTDAIENTTMWQIPPGVTVSPGGHLVFWADEQTEQGPTHVGFKLDGDGERLALYAGPQGYNGLIDEIYYGPQTVDRVWGRYPDGGAAWRALLPTPGQPNRQPPPTFDLVSHSPRVPSSGQTVTVAALLRDDSAVFASTLYYSASPSATLQGFQAVPMQPVVGDLYSAQIPAQAAGVVVAYYVSAQDDLGALATYPEDAPDATLGYQVGYQAPPLFINEFLADNDSVNVDEQGEYEDWIELYNAGDSPLDVGGMYLSDDLGDPTQWRLPDGTTIPAGGFLLVWADDDEADGPLHANFKLGKDGEEIGLFDQRGTASALVDSVVFGPQETDVSTGRLPDGGETWTTFATPTPGQSNTAFLDIGD